MTTDDKDKPIEAQLPTLAIFYDAKSRRVARVYAAALLLAAEKQGLTDQVKDELESLVEDVFDKSPTLEKFLTSPAVSRDTKELAIKKAFTQASPLFQNFLLVLNHHDRLDLLRTLLVEFAIHVNQLRRQTRVVVTTAQPMEDSQREAVLSYLRDHMQVKPLLVETVEPDILGGMILRVRDWVYDSSLRTRLLDIRNQLFERTSHEIQSRRDHFSTADGN